jgi:GNAT superfamily N-acetyltransferase
VRIFAVISADKAAERVLQYMDSQDAGAARDLDFQLTSLISNIKTTLTDKGAHLHVVAMSRVVADLPEESADCLVPYIEQAKKVFRVPIAAGFGRSLAEAMAALSDSQRSGEIEVYGDQDTARRDTEARDKNEPVNTMADPTTPQRAAMTPKPDNQDVPSRPSVADTAKQAVGLAQMVLGVQPQPPPQPAPAQTQPQPAQAPNAPRKPSLRDLLRRPDEKKAEPAEAPKPQPQPPGPHEKMSQTLEMIRGYLPNILGLASTNPKAFSQAMGLVSKIAAMSKAMGVAMPESITTRLSKAKIYDLKTKRLVADLPSEVTPMERQYTVVEGKKKIVPRSYLRQHHEPTKPNRAKIDGDGKATAAKAELSKEELKKPTVYDPGVDVSMDTIEPAFRKIKIEKLPNGLEHHIFQNYDSFVHELRSPGDRSGYPLARINISRDVPTPEQHDITNDPVPTIHYSLVNPKYRGKGLGQQLYLAALSHHKRLVSDSTISRAAHKVWKRISKVPGINAYLGEHVPYDINPNAEHDPHTAETSNKLTSRRNLFPKVSLSNRLRTSSVNGRSAGKSKLGKAQLPAKKKAGTARGLYERVVQQNYRKGFERAKPLYYGRVGDVHVMAATHPDHANLIGKHSQVSSMHEFESALGDAQNKGFRTLILHGDVPKEIQPAVKQLGSGIKKAARYPVGTVLNGKKKVLVDGRPVWRDVRSGLVLDPNGQPVSVRSSNSQAAGKPMTKDDKGYPVVHVPDIAGFQERQLNWMISPPPAPPPPDRNNPPAPAPAQPATTAMKAEPGTTWKLVGTAPSKQLINHLIDTKWNHSKNTLHDKGGGVHDVHNAKGKMEGVRVREHEGRWRFERTA